MRHLKLTPLTAEGTRIIRVPKALADRELLVRGRDYEVRFGLRRTAARLGIADGHDPDGPLVLGLSCDALNDLLLRPGSGCRLRVEGTRGPIIFGPLVGVLVSPRFLEAFARDEIPVSARLHAEAASAEGAAIFYFAAEEVAWERKAAVGWVPDRQGAWSRRRVPLPDVVYDRAVYGRRQDRAEVESARGKFSREPGVKLINARHYLDKWRLHQRLMAHPGISGCLPETERYRGLNDLERFFGRHNHVFVKSFYGSGGMEVVSIEAAGSGEYACQTRRGKTMLGGLRQVETFIGRFFETDELIIQEGLDLVRYRGSIVDMRSLVQKDGTGDWGAPQIMLRVAKGELPMANLYLGGRAAPYDELMPLILGGYAAAQARYAEACDLSLALARHIEHEYGPFGEIGLDLALDKHGRFWFLEANAKPDKNPEPFERRTGPAYPQFQNVLAYARHLANFTGPSWRVE